MTEINVHLEILQHVQRAFSKNAKWTIPNVGGFRARDGNAPSPSPSIQLLTHTRAHTQSSWGEVLFHSSEKGGGGFSGRDFPKSLSGKGRDKICHAPFPILDLLV